MIKRVKKYIEKQDLLPQNKKPSEIIIVVGLSGGADSVVLLSILNYMGYNCIAAHCNFHLRGKESLRDEKISKKIAEGFKIAFIKQDFDTIEFAKEQGISIEMAARNLRYEWFEKIRVKEKAHFIAVAHHSDDNIETFLLNMIRGTGLKGLTGIPSKNGKIIRPLLSISKKEIVDYAHKKELQFINDSTNLQDEFTRNKIRLTLIPFLRCINPSIDRSILRTIENLIEVQKIYDNEIKKNMADVFNPLNGIIDINKLSATVSPESTLFEILKAFNFERDVIKNIANAINSQSGKEFHAPGHILIKDREKFILLPKNNSRTNYHFKIENKEQKINEPISLEILFQEINESFSINKGKEIAYFDVDKLVFPLILRKWEKGDRFMPLGMSGFQKLSDFFNNNKISKPEKQNTWLICSGNDIIWIVGHRTDNRYKIDNTSQKACIIKLF